MFFSIAHVTRFHYSGPVSESLMELRMRPRNEGGQRCVSFDIVTEPRSQVFGYRDYLGNTVHHFDVPAPHQELTVRVDSTVETTSDEVLPPEGPKGMWDTLDDTAGDGRFFDFMIPSQFAEPTDQLEGLMKSLDLKRLADPISTIWMVNKTINEHFDYVPQSTTVDSPIDDALSAGRGVCQDFSHIMIAVMRQLGVPTRYVSGYTYNGDKDLEMRSAANASHAWVECWLPGHDWVGFDPTNNLQALDHHIRVAVGRDYADLPPSRGVYRGGAESELAVAVKVALVDKPPVIEDELLHIVPWQPVAQYEPADPNRQHEQNQFQQQQQQQQ